MRPIDALRLSETFHGLPESDLAAVAEICRLCEYEPGSIIFHEGQVATDLYVVVEGRVALEKAIVLNPRGGARHATVYVVERGQVVGWSAAIAPHELTATAVCVDRTFVASVEGEALRRLLQARPVFGFAVVSRLATISSYRLRDITHRLTYLLAIASHDLRAPLSAAESYLQLVLGGYLGPVPENQRETLTRSSERIREGLDIVSNFLDISRLESGQMSREMEIGSVANVAKRAVEVIQPTAKGKGVDLKVDTPDGLPAIRLAGMRLQQVLVNLLGNAVKFTPPGGKVHLILREEADSIRVEVVDTGIGIASGDLPHIFDDFFRGSHPEVAGSGLGLSVAKRVVLGHGGRIWAESPVDPSAENKGSRFVLTLPK